MSNKQTRCPDCFSIYKVTVPQLTVAQGLVCCPKCSTQFNAFAFLSEHKEVPQAQSQIELLPQRSFLQLAFQPNTDGLQTESSHDVMTIFELKVKHSNLNLRQYLNHLDYLQHAPVHYFPGLNLSSNSPYAIDHSGHTQPLYYYMIWGLINFSLAVCLILQLLWLNPDVVDRYPSLKQGLNQSCIVLSCQTIEQRYEQMEILNLNIIPRNSNQTQFTGELVNHYDSSLKLPILKISYEKNNQPYSKIYTANEYLVRRFNGISRIPRKLPYEFEFTLPEAYHTSIIYQIEILHP